MRREFAAGSCEAWRPRRPTGIVINGRWRLRSRTRAQIGSVQIPPPQVTTMAAPHYRITEISGGLVHKESRVLLKGFGRVGIVRTCDPFFFPFTGHAKQADQQSGTAQWRRRMASRVKSSKSAAASVKARTSSRQAAINSAGGRPACWRSKRTTRSTPYSSPAPRASKRPSL